MRFAAVIGAVLFLLFHASPVPITAQKKPLRGTAAAKTQPPSTAVLKKKYLVTGLTKADMQTLLGEASPTLRKRMAEDPQMKKDQVKMLRELLAVASQAVNSGTIDSGTAAELDNLRIETMALLYDQKINKNNDQEKPLSTILPGRIKAFYTSPANKARFDKYLKEKIEQAKKDGSMPADRVVPENEIEYAKNFFARIAIYDAESKLKAKTLGAEYVHMADLKVRLQQTQYVARLYTNSVLSPRLKVSDQEIDGYIAGHPELKSRQKARALQVLARVKAGEDFAALANEVSEDPGNLGDGDAKQGGLYADVPLGKMVPTFERAALALQPGQITPDLVETDFGYHIIKLYKKSETSDERGNPTIVYDVRHILISTMIESPDSGLRPQTIHEMVREKLETAKEKRVMEELLRNNPVSVAEDFEVSAT